MAMIGNPPLTAPVSVWVMASPSYWLSWDKPKHNHLSLEKPVVCIFATISKSKKT